MQQLVLAACLVSAGRNIARHLKYKHETLTN